MWFLIQQLINQFWLWRLTSETNEIVKEIQGSLSSLSFSNCNGNETEQCAGPGYEIALCGAATQYCPECEAKYCIYDNGSYYQEFYNPATGLEFYIYTYDYEYYDYDYCKYPQKRIIVLNN